MKSLILICGATLLAAAAPARAQLTTDEILAAAPAADWVKADPADLVMIDLANGKRVTILLASDLAPAHVANLRALIRSHWFDHGSVYRVDRDYIIQFGQEGNGKTSGPEFNKPLPAEYERPAAGLRWSPLPYRDTYARRVGYHGPFPIAVKDGRAWMTHCYGIVGAARWLNNTGAGDELFAVIGSNARMADRNVALIGRVIDQFEEIATLPPGSGENGRYEKPEQATVIARVIVAADLPEAARPGYEWLRPDSTTYGKWVRARATWHDEFFKTAADAVDVCHGMPPVRPVEKQPGLQG